MATEEWRALRRQKPVNEARIATYRRLMEAEALLEPVRRFEGVDPVALTRALDASLAESAHEEDIYLATLARYIDSLGGLLEVRAVFEGRTIGLPAPGPGRASTSP